MDFKKISQTLSKYKNLVPPDDFLKTNMRDILRTHLNIFIEKKDIAVERDIIYVNVQPILKNEILLKKDFLLKSISEISPKKKIKDIR